jgi:hypothetical protein
MRIQKLIGCGGIELSEERSGSCTAIVDGKEYKTNCLSDDTLGVYNFNSKRIYVAWSDILMIIKNNVKYVGIIDSSKYKEQTNCIDFSGNNYCYENVLSSMIKLSNDTFLLTEYSRYYTQLSAFAHPAEYFIYKFLTAYDDLKEEEHRRISEDSIQVIELYNKKEGYLQNSEVVYIKDTAAFFQLYKCPLYIDKNGNLYLAVRNNNDLSYAFLKYKVKDLKKFSSDIAKIKLLYGGNQI